MMVEELEPPVKRRRIVSAIAAAVPTDPYDEKLLNEWLGEWAWHMTGDRGTEGFAKKVPGITRAPHAACPDYEAVRYEESDAERSAVITVIVYEELPVIQRLAVEKAFLFSFVKTIRYYEDQLREGKLRIAVALKKRGYPL